MDKNPFVSRTSTKDINYRALYDTNDDFRNYVDRCMAAEMRHLTLQQVLDSPLVQEVGAMYSGRKGEQQ